MARQAQRWRDEFIHAMGREGVPIDVARRVLRAGTTLQRLAEAQCNGDWPADNGTKERPVVECQRCGSWWVASSMVYAVGGPGGKGTCKHPAQEICKDCRTQELVEIALKPYGLKPFFAGDPRGAVLSVVRADVAREDFESGRVRALAVAS